MTEASSVRNRQRPAVTLFAISSLIGVIAVSAPQTAQGVTTNPTSVTNVR